MEVSSYSFENRDRLREKVATAIRIAVEGSNDFQIDPYRKPSLISLIHDITDSGNFQGNETDFESAFDQFISFLSQQTTPIQLQEEEIELIRFRKPDLDLLKERLTKHYQRKHDNPQETYNDFGFNLSKYVKYRVMSVILPLFLNPRNFFQKNSDIDYLARIYLYTAGKRINSALQNSDSSSLQLFEEERTRELVSLYLNQYAPPSFRGLYQLLTEQEVTQDVLQQAIQHDASMVCASMSQFLDSIITFSLFLTNFYSLQANKINSDLAKRIADCEYWLQLYRHELMLDNQRIDEPNHKLINLERTAEDIWPFLCYAILGSESLFSDSSISNNQSGGFTFLDFAGENNVIGNRLYDYQAGQLYLPARLVPLNQVSFGMGQNTLRSQTVLSDWDRYSRLWQTTLEETLFWGEMKNKYPNYALFQPVI